MALIKCPECKRKISNTAFSCPHCGYVLGVGISSNNGISKNKSTKTKHKAGDVIVSIIKLEWVDDVADFLMDIPIIGGLLSILFAMLCVIGAGAVALAIVICVFWGLYLLHPIVAIVAGAIGMNAIAYCASYVWGGRKKWYFWLCLSLTILAPIVLLGMT